MAQDKTYISLSKLKRFLNVLLQKNVTLDGNVINGSTGDCYRINNSTTNIGFKTEYFTYHNNGGYPSLGIKTVSIVEDGLMTKEDKVKLDGLASGTKLTYTFDSSSRKVTFTFTSGDSSSNYNFYYRKSTGVLGKLTASNNAITIPSDASDVIEVIAVNNSTNNRSLVII